MHENKALEYARWAVKRNNKDVPKYVKKQCREFIEIAEGKSEKYMLNEEKIVQIENILKLLNMPRGIKARKSLYECTCGYQWLFYIAVLAVVHRDEPGRRRYETAVLEICRKNFKTYTVGTIFILLFFLEPQFAEFFSVAPDGALSREVYKAISQTLKSSPLIYLNKKKPRFKINRDYIKFLLKESVYTPLNYSNSTLDGRLPTAFLADEVGGLPTPYAVEAMRSGQLGILNKLGCIISTKYPSINNPFEDEVAYAKRVLDKIDDDETVFALLYEPDNPKDWITDDTILKQSNPAALENPNIWESLLKKRARAISIEAIRENFLTKHCNIIYLGSAAEAYVDVNDVQKCKVKKIEWRGRAVYVGVDLALTNDNCSVALVSLDGEKILVDVIAFIPEGRIEEKSRFERVDYNRFIEAMKCIACGDRVVDYGVIEDFVFRIEQAYGVHVIALGYDRMNALSSAQKWERGIDGKFEPLRCVQVRQHSDTLHQPTKLLAEKIAEGNFEYEDNTLLEINFENCRCVYDTNLNRYITKKKSSGKVDMVFSILDALCVLLQEAVRDSDYISQSV